MTLKEQLEILRGEPIREKAPIEQIPCIETSDPEKLCKHPVVSVNMITYNHEPYIRQAIEGVMMQQTDFEFELVIGEDASQDKTREICFEYQQKYPDKIRVLWSEENVYHLGGNGRRVRARSRGEFIAFCEGDDYWTDPLKLQKQVDVMRTYPNIGLCFAQSNILMNGVKQLWIGDCFPEGLISGRKFLLWHGFGRNESPKQLGEESFIMTATVLIRHSILKQAIEKYEVFKWRMLLGDTTTWLGISSLSNVYFLKEPVAIYRKHSGGAMASAGARMSRDGLIIRMFYGVKALEIPFNEVFGYMKNIYTLIMFSWLAEMLPQKRKIMLRKMKQEAYLKTLFNSYRAIPMRFVLWSRWITPFSRLWACRFWMYMPRHNNKCPMFHNLYKES